MDGDKKSSRGGFAVGGFTAGKGLQELFRVTSDSTRIYIDDSPGKSSRGGFAVGGFTAGKNELGASYFNITSDDSGIIDNENRVLWYPIKNAFLAGRINISNPNQVGTNSASIGFRNIASGNYSQAFGYESQASGDYSIAIGNNSKALAESTFAFGYATEASGPYSIAMGLLASSTNLNSISLGAAVFSTAESSVAIGNWTYAEGSSSIGIGVNAVATRNASVAIGQNTTATGAHAYSMGYYAHATSAYSFSIGRFAVNTGNTTDWIATDPLFVIGNGNNTADRSNAMTVLKNGRVGIGTTTPTQMLTLTGNIQLEGGASRYIYFSESNGYIGTTTATRHLYLRTNNLARMTIRGDGDIGIGTSLPSYRLDITGTLRNTAGAHFATASGNVGIGTTTPGSKLEVNGETRTTRMRVGGNTDGTAWAVGVDGSSVFRGNFRTHGYVRFVEVYNYTVGTTNRTLRVDADGYIGGLASSIRYKENVIDVQDIEWLYQLRPVLFNYKNDPEKKQVYGLIAEEVEEINPKFVVYSSEGLAESVNYEDLITPLLKAIQEQNNIIEEQRIKLEMLQKEIEQVKEKIDF